MRDELLLDECCFTVYGNTCSKLSAHRAAMQKVIDHIRALATQQPWVVPDDIKIAFALLGSPIDAAPKAEAQEAARYRFWRDRLIGADFEWGEEGESVLVFSLPTGCRVWASLDRTTDAALSAQRAEGG